MRRGKREGKKGRVGQGGWILRGGGGLNESNLL